MGGIAVQTLAIVAADAAHRHVNLEHAAASTHNLLFGCLLIVLLSVALLASFSPQVTVLGVHPASAVMVGVYLGGLKLIQQEQPMWKAVITSETRTDQLFLTTAALLMTTVLLGGLLVRQRHGWWRLGFDGILLLTVYAVAVFTLAF